MPLYPEIKGLFSKQPMAAGIGNLATAGHSTAYSLSRLHPTHLTSRAEITEQSYEHIFLLKVQDQYQGTSSTITMKTVNSIPANPGLPVGE